MASSLKISGQPPPSSTARNPDPPLDFSHHNTLLRPSVTVSTPESTTQLYELLEEDRVTGPHSLVVLRQKADIRVIDADTLIRPAHDTAAPWRPLREDAELMEFLLPKRSRQSLGSTRFANTNTATDAASQPVDVMQILRHNSAVEASQKEVSKLADQTYPYRRRRDYLVSAAALNLFCVVTGLMFGFVNPFVIAAFVMGNVCLAWVLFGVMDKY